MREAEWKIPVFTTSENTMIKDTQRQRHEGRRTLHSLTRRPWALFVKHYTPSGAWQRGAERGA